MSGVRIEFPSGDAARFNELRDRWRGVAAGYPLSASARRVAMVLPTFVNREFGYAFPTDDDLRAAVNASRETIKRGLKDLDDADLIERATRTKRGDDGKMPGKERRIFLTMPMGQPKGQPSSPPKGQAAAAPKGQPMGQAPMGQPSPKGQKSPTEGSYGGPNIPDRTTPDFKIRSGDRKVGVYEGPDPSVARPQIEDAPSPDPSVSPQRGKTPADGGSVPSDPPSPKLGTPPGGLLKSEHTPSARPPTVEQHRNPYPTPKAFDGDFAFLDAFDQLVVEIAGDDVPAGEINRITGQAFDRATDSDDGFMPFHWESVCALRDDGATANWFRWRAGALIHRKAAA